MNGKVARMIRQFKGSRRDKQQWRKFPHTLRGKIRTEFKEDLKLMPSRPTSWPQ